MKLRLLFPALTASGLLLSNTSLLASGGSGDDNGSGKANSRNAACANSGTQVKATITQSNGGSVVPSGSSPNDLPPQGVSRTFIGAGQGTFKSASPLQFPMKAGREYSVNWTGFGVASLHTSMEPVNFPEGYEMHVDKGDGNGWVEGNSAAAIAPAGQTLNPAQQTMKFRVVRPPSPVGKTGGITLTRPVFLTQPAAVIGVTHVDADNDTFPDTEVPRGYSSLSLGASQFNGRPVSAGHLVINKELWVPSTQSFDVNSGMLSYEGISGIGVGKVLIGGLIRQVIAPEVIADIVTVANGFEIRLYEPSALGAQNPDGSYALSGSHYAHCLIEKVGGIGSGYNYGLKISQYMGGVLTESASLYARRMTPTQWETTRIEGAYTEVVHNTVLNFPAGGQIILIAGQPFTFGSSTGSFYRQETVTQTRDGSQTAEEKTRYVLSKMGEKELDRESKYGSGSNDKLVTQHHHEYLPSAQTPQELGQKIFRYNPDGSWESYTYNEGGYVTKKLRPWKGVPATPWNAGDNDGVRENISYDVDPYYPVPANAPSGVSESESSLVKSRELFIQGVRVSKTTYSYIAFTHNGEPALRKTTVEETTSGNTLTSIEETYHRTASNGLRGHLISTTSPGGQKTSWSYELGTWDATNKVFNPSPTGRDMRETVTNGTTASPNGIANQTIRKIIVRNAAMKILREETLIYTGGSTYESATVTHNKYDDAGRLTETEKDGRIVETRSYSGLVTTITDESGVIRVVTRDTNNRITSDAKQGGPTASTVYNGTQATTTIGTLSSIKAVDLLGRESSSTAVDGSVVTTTYPSNGKDKQVTYPGSLSVYTTRYPGGLEQSITNVAGTSIVPRYYTHGVNADGTQWTQTNYGTAASPRWSKTTRDWLGRVIKEESPAPSGTGNVTKTIEYNSGGLKSKESYSANAGLADRIYEYDSLGNLYRVGIDFNGSGLDEASADTITEYTFNYHKEGSEWYQQRLVKEYQTDNSNTATTVETTRVRLKGNHNGNAGYVVNVNAAGVTTEVTETFDILAKTRTLTTTRSDRSGSATQKWINGLLKEEKNSWDNAASTYGYDALDRLETMVNPRTNSTLTRAYNAQNQLETLTDGDNNVTSFFYHPATHANAGQIKEVRDAKNKSVHYEYNDLGQNTRIWGAAAKPSEKAYDTYGQLSTLKTYRVGSGWTAATWPSGSEGTADTTTWRYFEATGLLKEKEDAATRKTTYTWKDNGRLHTRTWQRGSITTLGYNAAGQETSRVYSNEPAGINTPDVTITRDRNGRVKTVSDGAGTSTHTYTESHQLDTVTYGASGILANYLLDYGFDAMGRQNSFTIKHNTTNLYQNTWGYEAVSGRLETIESGTHKAKYFRYKNSSLIQQITWENNGQPIMHNTRAYDSLSRLTATTNLIQNANGVQPVAHHGYEYDELHRRTKTTLLDGSYWSYVYNDRSELTGADKHLSSGTMLAGQQYHFGFDNAGNRTSKQVGGDSAGNNRRNFTTPSNNLNQYASFATPGYLEVIGKAPAANTVTVNSATATRQGDYFRHELTATNTGNGAWVSVSVADGGSPVTGHRYIPPASFTPSYDLDGNLTSDGEWDYTYDAENRLIKAQRTTAAQNAGAPYRRMEYAYDSAHRRIQAIHYHGSTSPPAKTEKYLYDNRNRCLTVNASNSPVQSFTWGLDALESIDAAGGGAGGLLWITDHASSETHLACTDGNANIVNLVNSTTKAVTTTYEYTPFGELLRITGSYSLTNPYRFSSKPQDSETGNYDYGFRSYKPSWASWLGRDPLQELGGNNLYGFLENTPVNGFDVLGGTGRYTGLRSYLGEVSNLMGHFGAGIYNGAKEAVEGIANLPEVFDFLTSKEGRDLMERLATDEEFRKQVFDQLGDEFCDFTDRLQNDPEFAFGEGGKVAFGILTGAQALKAISAMRKAQEVLDKINELRKIKKLSKALDNSPLTNKTPDAPTPKISSASPQSKTNGGKGPVEKGQEGVERSRQDAINRGDQPIGEEVTVELPSGKRSRADLLTKKPDGSLEFVESKNGPSARLTKNQKELKATLDSGGSVTPRGKRAVEAGLTPGKPVGGSFRLDRF